jgi:hypothetical protein
MKIYIACGLTHVPRNLFREHTSFIHQLASELRRTDDAHEVRYALVNSDPQLAAKPFGERARLCYLWDRDMVEQADLVIAELSFPSTGVGIEMQIATAIRSAGAQLKLLSLVGGGLWPRPWPGADPYP